MSKTQRKNGKDAVGEYVGAHLSTVEAKMVDFAAALVNGKCPKRTEGLRHLIKVGFRQLASQDPGPSDVGEPQGQEAVA